MIINKILFLNIPIIIIIIKIICANDDVLSDYKLKTWKNKTFYGFKGIRYAEPPIGALRFQAPVPYRSSWNLTNNDDEFIIKLKNLITTKPNPCPSPYTKIQNEDCLFLNVYTPEILSQQRHHYQGQTLRPVIAFIHPGGFYVGSGNAEFVGPEYILEEDIILVTFNYRLGFFGFSATGDYRSPGNAGLKDQSLALKWIKENIHLFGGDSNCITLMGYSAGAMSVSLHLVSPMSHGLFHRAIIMSGSLPPQLNLPSEQLNLIEKQAKLLNCNVSNSNDNWFNCLKLAKTNDLSRHTYSMFEFGHDNPIFLWLPVVEPEITANTINNKPFLTAESLERLRNGNLIINMPILIGTTLNELSTSSFDILNNETLFNEWKNNFQKLGPISFMYQRNGEKSHNISDELSKYYGFNTQISFNNLSDSFSDAVINFGVHNLASKLSLNGSPVFYYKFTYNGGKFSHFRNGNTDRSTLSLNNPTLNNELGDGKIVEHCDDLQYIFRSNYYPNISANIDGDDEDLAIIVGRQIMLITSFAKFGYPVVLSEKIKFIDWPLFSKDNEEFLNIGRLVRIQKCPFKNYEIWNKLFLQ